MEENHEILKTYQSKFCFFDGAISRNQLLFCRFRLT